MPTAKAEDETIQGVAGVRYYTGVSYHWDQAERTSIETRLQEIQKHLAGGEDRLPEVTTLPHLKLYDEATVLPDGTPGPTVARISLWVPINRTSEVEALLADAGVQP